MIKTEKELIDAKILTRRQISSIKKAGDRLKGKDGSIWECKSRRSKTYQKLI